jgi:hypothetical protein
MAGIAAGLCLVAGGCGGDEPAAPIDAAVEPDIDGGFSCEASGGGGEPFDLLLGIRTEGGDFDELADGDDATLVLGFQGFYMMLLEAVAGLPTSDAVVCLECVVELSPSVSGSFAGAVQNVPLRFAQAPTGDYTGTIPPLILAAQSARPQLDGAEVQLSLVCEGHGLTGAVERTVRFAPE